ncbi:MAG: hypothetical protein Q8S31_06920 [Alphaproteobacteria bacterium]|nr:hypothetical protein [Alphaproteobacteria bacterium]
MKILSLLVALYGFFIQELHAVIIISTHEKDHEITFENGTRFNVPNALKIQLTDDKTGIMISEEQNESSENFIIFDQKNEELSNQNYSILEFTHDLVFEIPFNLKVISNGNFLIVLPENNDIVKVKHELGDSFISNDNEYFEPSPELQEDITTLINYFDHKNNFVESFKKFFSTQQIETKIHYLKKLYRFSTNEIAQHISGTFLGRIYLLGLGSTQKNPERVTIAFKLLIKAAAKEHCPWAKNIAIKNLAKMYLLGLGPTKNNPFRFQKTFDLLMNIPHELITRSSQNRYETQFNYYTHLYQQTTDSVIKHVSEVLLARMYQLGIGPTQYMPNRIQIAIDLFTEAVLKEFSPWAKHVAEANFAQLCLDYLIPHAPDNFQILHNMLIQASEKTFSFSAQNTAKLLLNRLFQLSLHSVKNESDKL